MGKSGRKRRSSLDNARFFETYFNTCPHGCVYCYAVQHRELALQRYKAHDPTSEFLFAPEHFRSEENAVSETPGIIPMAHVGKKNWLSEQPGQDVIVKQ